MIGIHLMANVFHLTGLSLRSAASRKLPSGCLTGVSTPPPPAIKTTMDSLSSYCFACHVGGRTHPGKTERCLPVPLTGFHHITHSAACQSRWVAFKNQHLDWIFTIIIIIILSFSSLIISPPNYTDSLIVLFFFFSIPVQLLFLVYTS